MHMSQSQPIGSPDLLEELTRHRQQAGGSTRTATALHLALHIHFERHLTSLLDCRFLASIGGSIALGGLVVE